MSVNVLFVCLGNICRSPTAEGFFRKLVEDAGLNEKIQIDSAGTANWHHGRAPDPRTITAAKIRNIDLSFLRARGVTENDFQEFDYILAMDSNNLHHLESMKPTDYKGHLGLFLEFGKQSSYSDVPDPYHGGNDGFELVLDLVEDAAKGLLDSIRKNKII